MRVERSEFDRSRHKFDILYYWLASARQYSCIGVHAILCPMFGQQTPVSTVLEWSQ